MTSKGSTQFIALRRRLDVMGYESFILGLDSAPLAQQLLNDVFTTTRQLQITEENLKKAQEELDQSKVQIEPLHAEQIRLVRENTQLHKLLIKMTEETRAKEKQITNNMYEVQEENRRVKLYAQKNEETIKEQQAEILRLKQLLELPQEAQEPTSSRSTRRASSRSRRNGSIAPSIGQSSYASNAEHEAEIKQLNQTITQLKETIELKEKEKETLITNINDLKDLMKLRDDEISRLGLELQKETGRDGYMISIRYKNQQLQEEIDKLQAQIDSGNFTNQTMPLSAPQSPTKPPPSPSTKKMGMSPIKYISIDAERKEEHEKSPNSDSSSKKSKLTTKTSSSKKQNPPSKKPNADKKRKGVIFDIDEDEKPSIESLIDDDDSSSDKGSKSSTQSQKSKESDESTKQMIESLKSENDSLKEDSKLLQAQLESTQKDLQEKISTIALMSAEVSFVGDNLKQIIAEKDQIIDSLKKQIKQAEAKSAELLQTQQKQQQNDATSEKIETLTLQLDELQAKYDTEIEDKDKKIKQLELLLEQLSSDKNNTTSAPVSCPECARLRQQIQDLKSSMQNSLSEQEKNELQSLRLRSQQLELIIRSSEESMHDNATLNQELLNAKAKITQMEQKYEELKQLAVKLQEELNKAKEDLEESEKISNTVPDLRQKFRTILERMKVEHFATVEELNQKNITLQSLSDKLLESQKLTRDFQEELQKCREQANNAREETLLHRSKSEEVQRLAADKIVNAQKEMNAAANHYKMTIQDLTNKNSSLSQILSDTRRQLAMTTEQTIPKLKDTIQKMTRERSELAARVESLAQMAQFAEKSTSFSPESIQFIAALHQFNDQMQPFLP
ncbi:hypothetical protein TVAG_068800 [Trichomonas vaginalis G3]|uniref:Uncharacterized protein n=1 Tax=Trichomonas vaginalis (strain ATCC PRA-98 / G3) TaxID=412133 RepID=A2EZK6_TRIV3|nr:centrosomal protein family [Trichomonas vaginalis G3]EAY01914.1 hypothetical protein TVAG_068800 [Trichomonas vaginalis G3]KAI5485284.1 centrosomal protein family [Trichomonas vaginalis G3]|eukprot:XP_001314453.1 hypothetical protein [Trichomonas vaginalis G3]